VVVLTMRADFYGKCAAHPGLAAALSDHQVLVGPMTEDELRRAIERPARLVGCEFEPGLVERCCTMWRTRPGPCRCCSTACWSCGSGATGAG
jgi:hypothetical protein